MHPQYRIEVKSSKRQKMKAKPIWQTSSGMARLHVKDQNIYRLYPVSYNTGLLYQEWTKGSFQLIRLMVFGLRPKTSSAMPDCILKTKDIYTFYSGTSIRNGLKAAVYLFSPSTEDGRSTSIFSLDGKLSLGWMVNFPAFIASKLLARNISRYIIMSKCFPIRVLEAK